MKKIILLLIVFCMSISVFAQEVTDYEKEHAQKLKNMMDKVTRMVPIVEEDFPIVFDYKVHEEKDQGAINVFYAAKSKCEKNPHNFAAVFNYGMLIGHQSSWLQEYHRLTETAIDEAYKYLERARNINNNFLPLHQEQERLIEELFFSGIGPIPFSVPFRIEMYTKYPHWAKRRLNSIKNQIRLGGKNINYLDAAILSLFVNLPQDHKFYLSKMTAQQKEDAVSTSCVEIFVEIDKHMRWAENDLNQQEQSLLKIEKTYVRTLERYLKDYLHTTEEYQKLKSYIKELKTEIAKKRSQAFSQQLGQQINAK